MPTAPPPAPRPWHRVVPLLPLLTAALLLGGVLLVVERTLVAELERRSYLQVQQSGWLFAEQLTRQLTRRSVEMTLFAGDAGLQPGADAAAVRAALLRLKNASSAYFWVGYVGADGVVLHATDGLLEGRSIKDRPVFSNGSQGLWFGAPHAPVAMRPQLQAMGRPVPDEVADLGMPLRGPGGELRAVIAAHLTVSNFVELRERVLGAIENRREFMLALVDPQGGVVLGPREGVPLLAAVRGLPDDTAQRVMLPDGRPHIVAQSAVKPPGVAPVADWHVVAMQPLDVALASAKELERQLWLVAVLTALVVGAAGMGLARRLSRPMMDLLDAVGERRATGGTPAPDLRQLAEYVRRLPARPAALSAGERMLQQLLQDASRLQQVLDAMPNPVLLCDIQQRVSYVNAAAAKVFGWPAAEALGRDVDEVLPPGPDAAGRRALRERLVSEPGPWFFKAESRRRDGAAFYGEWDLSRIDGDGGQPLGWLLVVRDLTERQEFEQRRREQAQVMAGIVDSASDAIVSVDREGCVTLFNPAAERIFGHTAGAVIGQSLDMLLPADAHERHHADVGAFAASGVTRRAMGSGPVRGLCADGSTRQLEASISQTTVAGRLVLTAILRDVTERAKSDEALARTRAELAALAQRLMAQEKDTTRRLAQVLHDGLGQTLVAARMTSDALMGAMKGEWPASQGARAMRLASLLDAAQTEVRGALVELRPPLLEDDGLAVALDTELRSRAAGAEGLRVACEVAPSARRQRWPADVEYAAFMVVREAVINAVQHSAGRSVTLRLDGDAGELTLRVDDDGIGFEAGQAPGPGHLGLVGMRERALAVDAAVRVQRREGGGTRVSFEWRQPD